MSSAEYTLAYYWVMMFTGGLVSLIYILIFKIKH